MSPKMGVLHDYDLQANAEHSARDQKCAVCDSSPMIFQWSDYSGEAMCNRCGCTYQLKWGSKQQKDEGKYPYLNLREDFVPLAREYWNERKTFVCYGVMLGPRPGLAELHNWIDEKHPEFK